MALLVGLAGCGPNDGATPNPSPAPKLLPRTALATPGFTFALVDDADQGTRVPDSYKVTYLSGSVELRGEGEPSARIGFRVDPAHPGGSSELLASNVGNAKAKGWPTTPVQADGGFGVTFLAIAPAAPGAQEPNAVKSVISKGPVTATITVEADASGNDAAKALHDKLLGSLRFHDDALTGKWPGQALAPQLPVTVDVPGDLVKDTYKSELALYSLDIQYGKYTSTMAVSWAADNAAAASAFAGIKKNLLDAGVRHQNDIKTNPALRSSLGAVVDEGFTFSLAAPDGIARYVGVLWLRGPVIVRTGANIGEIPATSFDRDSNATLATPMAIAKSWSWTTP